MNLSILKFFNILCFLIITQGKVEANSYANKSVENAKIVIIGAGVSGIAAASKLFENGFKEVTILEAENRIGGRIFTTKFGDYEVDLGAQWVHGENGNAIFDLAWPLDLLDKSDGHSQNLYYFDSNGTRLNKKLEEQLRNFYFDYLFEESETGFESYGEYVEDAFNRKFGSVPKIYKDRTKYLNSYELNRLVEEGSDSWFEISAQPIELYTDYPGDQNVNWKTRGYSTLVDYLIKRYPNRQEELPVVKNTLLNSEVVKINYLNRNKNFPILVSTKNRKTYEADHVIMTASIGVLKAKHSSLFVPRLPKQIAETINGFSFGKVSKIYLLFKEPFWDLGDKKILQFSFLWNNTERRSIENCEKKWILGMESVSSVEHKPKLLEIWIVGKYARLMERISEDKLFKHTVENLHRFLGKTYNITRPTAILRTTWFSNPNFRGTYSYRSVKMQKQGILSKNLEEPVSPKNLRILFAGEATSVERYSTVDGAMTSGWKAANRLIDFYKYRQKTPIK